MEPPVDLDRPETWPVGLIDAVRPFLQAIVDERIVTHAHNVSGARWHQPSPPTPATDEALTIVRDAMERAELRVFHATRLHDWRAITANGLRALDLQERVAAVRQALADFDVPGLLAEFDPLIAGADLAEPSHARREGLVYAVPARELLHDGGCEVFFSSFGGEAVQRICWHGSDQLKRALSEIGHPAVVTFRIPSFGVCEGSAGMLPKCMLDIMLRAAGLRDGRPEYWDVRMRRSVPATWIEAVYPHDHPFVAA